MIYSGIIIAMADYDEKLKTIEQINSLYADSAVRDRTYYPEFRSAWDSVLRNAAVLDDYECKSEDAIFEVRTTFCGVETGFRFDQLKIDEWFNNEQKRNSKAVFYPKRLKRDLSGTISYRDCVCKYNPSAEEKALSDENRNIIAAAIPSMPPELSVVYGNKWVNDKFTPLKKRSISMFLIETDYAPAFLMSPFEVCEYLFMMDYCIIKSDYKVVKDEDLKKFLHIFRPSPMLKIKNLI